MKTKLIITTLILSLTLITNAQPLPPSDATSNPVPVGGMLVLLPVVIISLGCIKLRKNK